MDRKLAFNCKTLEDAQDFIYQCIKRDIQVWRCATWDVNKENTCFVIEGNRLMCGNKTGHCISQGYEIVSYEKGDNIYGGKFEKLKGEGQCTCDICKSANWTNWCYRVFDRNEDENEKLKDQLHTQPKEIVEKIRNDFEERMKNTLWNIELPVGKVCNMINDVLDEILKEYGGE